MTRAATMVAVLLTCGFGQAEEALKFHWKDGQTLTYRVEQQTHAMETTGEGKSETKTKLALTKRWQVQSVDAAGIATLQHSLLAVRMETVTPKNETILFDSANPDKSDPKLKEQMEALINVPLSTLRVDATGKVVEVKEIKFGAASKFDAEPPFLLVLPGKAFKAGDTWERKYDITQEPPLGTGEKFEAVQKHKCDKIEGSGVYVNLATELITVPENLAERVPLLQLQPEGTIVFDKANGRLHSAVLRVSQTLKDHLGAGTNYSFESTYRETLVTGSK